MSEISFLSVVVGIIAGLFVGGLLALPIVIIAGHPQLLRILDYIGFFEVGALSAVALWVLIYKKLVRRFYPAHYLREERLSISPNREPYDPDTNDYTSPDPTDGSGGANVEIPEGDQFSQASLQENLQHLDTELEDLDFHDLMLRIKQHMPTVEEQPIFPLLDYLNRQGARIDHPLHHQPVHLVAWPRLPERLLSCLFAGP